MNTISLYFIIFDGSTLNAILFVDEQEFDINLMMGVLAWFQATKHGCKRVKLPRGGVNHSDTRYSNQSGWIFDSEPNLLFGPLTLGMVT